MFRELFTGFRNSPIGGLAGSFTLPGFGSEGDILYIADALGTIDSIEAVAAGRLLRSAGLLTVPAWSTLTMPDTLASGGMFYASSANVLAPLAITTAGKVVRSTGAIPAYSTFTIPDTL